jgi:uncharacterized protein YutE (UPF0331/DUF86 family)
MPIDIDVIESRVRDVVEVINELKRLTSKSFTEMSIDEINSMKYLVEALASICLHIAVDHFGLRPKSYTECFREVSRRLGVECYRDLEALVRLRNLLVHRYQVVRDDIVYNNVKTDFRCVNEFIEKIKKLVKI